MGCGRRGGEGLGGSPSPTLTWTQALRAQPLHPPTLPPNHHGASAGVISNWTDEHRLPPCTIFQAFKYYLDITTPPTPLQLQQFASLATSEKEKERLLVLSKVGPCSPHGCLSSPSPWRAVEYCNNFPAGGSLEQVLPFSGLQKVAIVASPFGFVPTISPDPKPCWNSSDLVEPQSSLSTVEVVIPPSSGVLELPLLRSEPTLRWKETEPHCALFSE